MCPARERRSVQKLQTPNLKLPTFNDEQREERPLEGGAGWMLGV